MTKLYFLDFEASSLSDQSYPISVGVVSMEVTVQRIVEKGFFVETGPIVDEMYHLIKPLPKWTDWDPKSEAIHCLTREHLAERGEEPKVVLQDIIDKLTGKIMVSDAPSYDQHWLDQLCRGVNGKDGFDLRLVIDDVTNISVGHEDFDHNLMLAQFSRGEEFSKNKTHGAQEDARDLAKLFKDSIEACNA